jgi:uncharacterized protein YraI
MTTLLQKTLTGVVLGVSVVMGSALLAPQAALAGHSDYGRTADARVDVELNIRYGPSTDYYVVDVVPRGRRVEIVRCLPQRDWCEVRYDGRHGWASSRYLYNPRYDRSYDRWDDGDFVIAFDFFANIFDWDNDRRHRYSVYRWGDDYYRTVHRSGYRGDREWRGHHRGHGNNHHDNGLHNGHRDRDGYYDRDWDRDHDRDRDRDGRWGR